MIFFKKKDRKKKKRNFCLIISIWCRTTRLSLFMRMAVGFNLKKKIFHCTLIQLCIVALVMLIPFRWWSIVPQTTVVMHDNWIFKKKTKPPVLWDTFKPLWTTFHYSLGKEISFNSSEIFSIYYFSSPNNSTIEICGVIFFEVEIEEELNE